MLALPILLLVPGTLTVCAVFGHKGRPRGTVFMGYAVTLSLVWLGFASLALYVLHILITADSTYLALLVVCAVLASVAQARLLRERQIEQPRHRRPRLPRRKAPYHRERRFGKQNFALYGGCCGSRWGRLALRRRLLL